MIGPTLARDIMVTNLVTLSAEMDVFDGIGLLIKYRISGAPVVDENYSLLGVFSERCCMKVLIESAYEDLPSSKVSSYMDRAPRTVTEETDLLTIAQIFKDSHYRRLPVVDNFKLIGQISRRDLLRSVHEYHRIAPDTETSLLYLSSLVAREDSPIG